MSELIPVVAIVGPTAVGKSALALRLAKSLDGEIISADSRQVYRFMDIGTAKPSIDERADVKHHLIDIVDPDGDYSLARFIEEASKAIQNVNTRSNLPLVVGGTGQYAWGLLEGWKAPKVLPNPELRQILAKKMAADGLSSLYDELVRRDPEAAKKIDARNPRRVIRALEVVYSAPGLAASEPRSIPPLYDVKIIGLTFERAALYRRIDDRVDAMIKSGWIDEVRGLHEHATRTTRWIEHSPIIWFDYVDDHLDKRHWREKFPIVVCFLVRKLGKEILVYMPENISIGVIQSWVVEYPKHLPENIVVEFLIF